MEASGDKRKALEHCNRMKNNSGEDLGKGYGVGTLDFVILILSNPCWSLSRWSWLLAGSTSFPR